MTGKRLRLFIELVVMIGLTSLVSSAMAQEKSGTNELTVVEAPEVIEAPEMTYEDHCLSDPATWFPDQVLVYGDPQGLGICTVYAKENLAITLQGVRLGLWQIEEDFAGYDIFIPLPADQAKWHQNVEIWYVWNENGFEFSRYLAKLTTSYIATGQINAPGKFQISSPNPFWITVYTTTFVQGVEQFAINGEQYYINPLTEQEMVVWLAEDAVWVGHNFVEYEGHTSFFLQDPPIFLTETLFLPMVTK